MAMTIAKFDTKHTDQIHDTQLDYYGRRLATCSADGSVRVFEISNPEDPKEIGDLSGAQGHSGAVWGLSWSHPKFPGLLASCGYDKAVIVWKEVQDGFVVVHRDDSSRASVNCVKFGPFECGLHLAAGSSAGEVAISSYNSATSQWTRTTFFAHACGVQSLCWAPSGCMAKEVPEGLEGAKIVTGGMDGAVKVWRFENGSWVREDVDDKGPGMLHHRDWVTSVNWRPNQQTTDVLASASKDGSVILWQRQDTIWRPIKFFREEFRGQPVWGVEFSQVGGMLCVSYGANQSAVFKEVAAGDFQQVLEMDENGIGGGVGGAVAPMGQTDSPVNLEAFGEANLTAFA